MWIFKYAIKITLILNEINSNSFSFLSHSHVLMVELLNAWMIDTCRIILLIMSLACMIHRIECRLDHHLRLISFVETDLSRWWLLRRRETHLLQRLNHCYLRLLCAHDVHLVLWLLSLLESRQRLVLVSADIRSLNYLYDLILWSNELRLVLESHSLLIWNHNLLILNEVSLLILLNHNWLWLLGFLLWDHNLRM